MSAPPVRPGEPERAPTSAGGSYSLRRRLLWFLLAAVLLGAAAQAAVSYRTALVEAHAAADEHLQQMAYALAGGSPMRGGAPTVDEASAVDLVVQVWTADGVAVFQSAARTALPRRPVFGYADMRADGTTYRVFSLHTRGQTVQVAQDLAVRRQMARRLALRTVAPVALLAPLLMLAVWIVVGRALAPVERARRQVARRAADDLSPLDERGLPEEVRPLLRELNLLFARVRASFDAQQRFVGDAAHELRSPLAALKLQVQAMRRAQGPARGIAEERLEQGIDRAARLVEQLLQLARQESAAQEAPQATAIDLTALVQSAIVDLMPLAEARQVDLGLHRGEAAEVAGDAEALRVLARNLLDNAVKYAPGGGTVDVTVRRDGGAVLLEVEDSGPGIAPAERERVFDRFYRQPGQAQAGSGLGLAIVRAIARQHGATVELGESRRLGGLRAAVRFAARRTSQQGGSGHG